MKAEEWQAMYQTMLDQKLISAPLDYNKLYTMEFLNNIYEGKSE
jgi:hypothetical protein